MQQPFSIIIPARYASSRLPGKMLADIAGKPMIQHVYERAQASHAERVAVATDDERIAIAVKSFGGTVYMTAADHQSGTDRLQETATLMGMSDSAIVVNIQGDEPLIPPEVVNQVAANLASDTQASVATLCEKIGDIATFHDPNAVKVVCDAHNRALYFSRAPIPWPRDAFSGNDFTGNESTSNESSSERDIPQSRVMAWRHIGIYAYRVKLLHDFVHWPVAPLENLEKLEQLRVLWQGHSIHVEQACVPVPAGVDTAEDLARVRKRLE
jgi:3-deoxy-manno-octulosonate cytidylyltransferase (CMP-KDO synthetase)